MIQPAPLVTALLLSSLSTALPAWADAADHWPSFRGSFARGVADDQALPVSWDVESGRNVRWRTEIPGMSHSSPIVWGDRVFLVTAVSEDQPQLVLGDEGGISLADEPAPHSWRLYALDAASGEVLWSREAFAGEPRAARHVKASQANSTPATDGESVAAIFGSQGLVVYDFDGQERWRRDLGVLDPGLFGDAGSQWGYASSPVIWRDRVIVQVDRHADSYLAAYDLESGKELWRVARDEKPVWSTPTIHQGPDRTELIVVGGDYDRAYDPATGTELWRFSRDFEVKTPTPFVAGDLVILAGGYRGQPLWALRTGATGDLSPPEEGAASEHVAWQSDKGGPYTSTPVAYGDQLYFVRDIGVLTSLALDSGERVYQERLASTFSASALASDGKLYLTGEDGTVYVVKAGPEFELLGRNEMGEPCMATPAIAAGTLYVRTRDALYAIAESAAPAAAD